jgi:outer membrane lipoprotein LolB
MTRHFSFRLAIGLGCLMLASCAAIKERTIKEPEGWVAEQQQRQQIQIWELRGRLGVQTETTGGGLDIIWKQSEQEYSIRLIAPLASGNYLIQGDNDYAEVRYPDGQKEIIDNIDDVFASILEVKLPVTAIKDWIRGLPARTLSIESIRWNDQGLLSNIKQSGWNVEMTKYTGSKILLPHAIYLSRDDKPELDIRLVLRQWLIDN